MAHDLLLSCDWGTTSFRLSLVNMQTHKAVCTTRNGAGTAATFNDWKINGRKQGVSRKDFYLNQLEKEIAFLWQGSFLTPRPLPVIISGMACSSIGIQELPYAPLPFSIDGSDLISSQLASSKDVASSVLLISGAGHQTDVMRGEETQVIGLSEIYKIPPLETAICIFPGTHSKHITVRDGKVIDFHTYMTGELFAVIQQHSILRESISQAGHSHRLTARDEKAFCLGLKQSSEANLLRSLFSVRINQLFSRLSSKANFFYLSGLLIGTELRSIPLEKGVRIILCAGRQVGRLYELAFQNLGLLPHAVIIPADKVDTIAFEAHIKILKGKLN